jgi:hypothetical protein
LIFALSLSRPCPKYQCETIRLWRDGLAERTRKCFRSALIKFKHDIVVSVREAATGASQPVGPWRPSDTGKGHFASIAANLRITFDHVGRIPLVFLNKQLRCQTRLIRFGTSLQRPRRVLHDH